MSDRRPQTWSGIASDMAELWSGPDGEDIAWEWIRGAVSARWGVESMNEMSRAQRTVAFQKTLGVLYRLRDEYELAFRYGVRRLVAEVFARYFDGVSVEGPPWRLDPSEMDRPSFAEWKGSAAFEDIAPSSGSEPFIERAPSDASEPCKERAPSGESEPPQERASEKRSAEPPPSRAPERVIEPLRRRAPKSLSKLAASCESTAKGERSRAKRERRGS